MAAPLPTLRRPVVGRDGLVHFGSKRAVPPYSQALCGALRNGRTLKPGATVTCVVCLDLKGSG